MSKKTIGILMPGDMGHGCGKVFLDNNLAVISALDGRSNRTKKLSESAGIENVGSIKNIVNYSDIILSILPPEAAFEQAEQVNKVILENKKIITYVDCNAISPKTSQKIDKVISSKFCNFIDLNNLWFTWIENNTTEKKSQNINELNNIFYGWFIFSFSFWSNQ